MKKSFSIPLLGYVLHTDETEKILTPYAQNRTQSEFVRKAIIKFADNVGFDYISFDTVKPDYISAKHWQQIQTKQQKSYGVDYTYAIAFWWLKSQSQFQHYNKSKLIKEIVCYQ